MEPRQGLAHLLQSPLQQNHLLRLRQLPRESRADVEGLALPGPGTFLGGELGELPCRYHLKSNCGQMMVLHESLSKKPSSWLWLQTKTLCEVAIICRGPTCSYTSCTLPTNTTSSCKQGDWHDAKKASNTLPSTPSLDNPSICFSRRKLCTQPNKRSSN